MRQFGISLGSISPSPSQNFPVAVDVNDLIGFLFGLCIATILEVISNIDKDMDGLCHLLNNRILTAIDGGKARPEFLHCVLLLYVQGILLLETPVS